MKGCFLLMLWLTCSIFAFSQSINSGNPYQNLKGNLSTLKADDISIFPNPFSSKFSLSIQGNSKHTIKIFDVLGREIKFDLSTSNIDDTLRFDVDMSKNYAGMYFVKLYDAKGVYQQTLKVKKL